MLRNRTEPMLFRAGAVPEMVLVQSLTAATLKGHEVNYKQKQCTIQRNGKLTAAGHCASHVWYIDCLSDSECDDVCSKLISGISLYKCQ